MPRSLSPVRLTESPDADLANYRALPGQAVIGLLLGLLSPLALIDPLLWSVPLLGIFVSVWALRRIKKNPSAIAGRKRALCGLTLALLSLAAAPTDRIAYRRIVQHQATQVADTWFRFLQQERPQAAAAMVDLPPVSSRPPAPGQDAAQPVEVDRFAMTPVAKVLLQMGPRAQVRFFRPVAQERQGHVNTVDLMYAVTYDDAGERKSFFVIVKLQRRELSSGEFEWRVTQTVGGARP
jgi:hypothetical protein